MRKPCSRASSPRLSWSRALCALRSPPPRPMRVFARRPGHSSSPRRLRRGADTSAIRFRGSARSAHAGRERTAIVDSSPACPAPAQVGPSRSGGAPSRRPLLPRKPVDHALEDHRIVVPAVTRAEEQGHRLALRLPCHGRQRSMLSSQLANIATAECAPPRRVVTEPLPELVRRPQLLHPPADRGGPLAQPRGQSRSTRIRSPSPRSGSS